MGLHVTGSSSHDAYGQECNEQPLAQRSEVDPSQCMPPLFSGAVRAKVVLREPQYAWQLLPAEQSRAGQVRAAKEAIHGDEVHDACGRHHTLDDSDSGAGVPGVALRRLCKAPCQETAAKGPDHAAAEDDVSADEVGIEGTVPRKETQQPHGQAHRSASRGENPVGLLPDTWQLECTDKAVPSNGDVRQDGQHRQRGRDEACSKDWPHGSVEAQV
mmetsp:Transcript_36248/g.104379  ORF Transcript_36248/g.104379 Transcript_36248/m.104379 type:complete len:215 (-) Transcript_36248:253-897(-)